MNTDKHRYPFIKILLAAFFVILLNAAPLRTQSGAPAGNGQSLQEVIEAIEKARVTTRILYVTAHPDDEPGALLAYLARGLHADVALLSLTRGEGGQNALGPEQAPQLGVLRTEELMNATRVYGTRLFFTRAKDFGFTKTPEEAMQVWGPQVLEDMVRVIRTFRPHVIINNWGGVRSGHGHHQASGILTPKAYAMAADPKAFPEQLREGLPAWKAESLLQISRGDASGGFSIPVSEVSPLWGKSWGEIGIEGYLNHRTQGVGGVRSSPFFRRAIGLMAVEGAKPDAALLAAPLTTVAGRFAGLEELLSTRLKEVDDSLGKAEKAAREVDWTEVALHLSRAGRDLAGLQRDVEKQQSEIVERAVKELEESRGRIDAALVQALALRMEATADRAEIVKGEMFGVTVQWRRRLEPALDLQEPSLNPSDGWVQETLTEQAVGSVHFRAAPMKVEESDEQSKRKRASERIISAIYPWPEPLATVSIQGYVHAYGFTYIVPVLATRVTSVSAETRPLMLVPAVTLTLEPKVMVVGGERPILKVRNQIQTEREIVVRVRHYATSAEKITVGVDVPQGWAIATNGSAGTGQAVEFAGAGDQLVRFTVKLPANIAPGKYELKAYAKRADGEEFRTSLEPLPTLPTRMWSEPSIARVHVMDVAVPRDLRVGYVTADNDPIPEALREIGVHVELLDEQALAFGDLSRYDAIAIGIRAYELRSDLARANQRLLDYAAAGGTLVVQYQREGVWNQLKPAPYPATATSQRTTDENSPVRMIDPKHPLLNFPNAIRAEDFSGWVQERGLYYWDKFDAKYTPVLAMKDPGEQEALGALVYAQSGKGVYIYTGLSFFRQLPEGVPGAYRLFVNLLSQSKRTLK